MQKWTTKFVLALITMGFLVLGSVTAQAAGHQINLRVPDAGRGESQNLPVYADQAKMNLRAHHNDTLQFRFPGRPGSTTITISTPHRGSEFANDYTRWLARKFIKLPSMAVSTGNRLAAENPELFRDTQLLTVANAIVLGLGISVWLVWRYRRRSTRVPVIEPTTGSSDPLEETERET